MFRKFFISHLLPNRYFPKIDVGCPWKELSMRRCPTILGDPGAVRRVDKMFVAKVYCKIDLTVNFHHEHFIDSTNCPWVSEDDVHLDSLWKRGLKDNDLYILHYFVPCIICWGHIPRSVCISSVHRTFWGRKVLRWVKSVWFLFHFLFRRVENLWENSMKWKDYLFSCR